MDADRQVGEGHLCQNLDRVGQLCAGLGIGFAERVGGGWSEAVLAHESMLLPADGLAPERAVLAEPAAVALHAVLRWRRSGDSAVVIGPGAIGLLVMAALRRLHPDLDLTIADRQTGPIAPRRHLLAQDLSVDGEAPPSGRFLADRD